MHEYDLLCLGRGCFKCPHLDGVYLLVVVFLQHTAAALLLLLLVLHPTLRLQVDKPWARNGAVVFFGRACFLISSAHLHVLGARVGRTCR